MAAATMAAMAEVRGERARESPDLRSVVLGGLAQVGGWATAASLRPSLQGEPSKTSLNEILYAMKTEGLVEFSDGFPPTWRLRPQPAPRPLPRATLGGRDADPLLHVVVDLGNCHDCLQNLLQYAEDGAVTVAAYADLAFAGFGVSPSISARNVQVFQADTPDKNSADVQIIWDVSRFVDRVRSEDPARQLHILVATKDLGFRRLRTLVETNPLHKLTFVTNWHALRVHVE